MDSLQNNLREKELENAQLKAAAEKQPAAVQTADVGIQSQTNPAETPTTTTTTTDVTTPPKPATARRHDTTTTTTTTTSTSNKRHSASGRIRSPVRRGFRHSSPRTSSGDLLDSSLDNEMRAAGVDVNDSYDSSEGVGFSDTNLDTSENSLAANLSAGELPVTASSSKRGVSSTSPVRRTAWGSGDGEQAQQQQRVNGEGVAEGVVLGEGPGSGEVEEMVGGVMDKGKRPLLF